MLADNDVTSSIDERSTERMWFRTTLRIKEVIQKAAALSRIDVPFS